MKIAIPIADEKLSMHFGHAGTFAIIDTDVDGNIVKRSDETPPPHEPGVLPAWLNKLGATHIIAGGMGARAQNLFAANNIHVIVGAPSNTPEELVSMFCSGTLVSGDNICDH